MDVQLSLSEPDTAGGSFRWRESDAYLFDIDGTLLNTLDGTHYHAFHNALRAVFGVDSSIDGVPVHGNTDIGILRAVLRREGIADAVIAQKLPRALDHMCAEVAQKAADIRTQLCPSITELLETLRTAGKLLGVVSGNLEPIGWAKLRAAGLRDYFALGSFSDRNEKRSAIFEHGIAEVRRQLGTQAAVCIVGDTPADVLAAQAVGVRVIAVATGIFALEDLRRLAPDLSVGCCTELLHI